MMRDLDQQSDDGGERRDLAFRALLWRFEEAERERLEATRLFAGYLQDLRARIEQLEAAAPRSTGAPLRECDR